MIKWDAKTLINFFRNRSLKEFIIPLSALPNATSKKVGAQITFQVQEKKQENAY